MQGIRHLFYAVTRRFSLTSLSLTSLLLTSLSSTLLVVACDVLPRDADTLGEQKAAAWAWSGRLVADTDTTLTLVRLRIDSAGQTERHDVLLARFDFNPMAGLGDEHSLTLGLDLGHARDLPVNQVLSLGTAGGLPAYGTVTCLCTPLRPDSVRGSLVIQQRGLRQLVIRINAVLHFTQWGDSTQHAVYPLRQLIFGVH
jgi:hypothetical protein